MSAKLAFSDIEVKRAVHAEQIEQMPLQQRYTSHKIFEILPEESYQGSESYLRRYLASRKKPTNQLPRGLSPAVVVMLRNSWSRGVTEKKGKESMSTQNPVVAEHYCICRR